jgi:hypothetical protein
MSDEASANQGVGRGNAQGSADALREVGIKPGECRNPNGMNGWRKAQSRIAEFMKAVANPDTGDETRFDRVLMAAYTSALIPGVKGAPDRKMLIEQVAGKAKAHVELSGPNGGGIPTVNLTVAEQRALLDRILSEPEGGKERDAASGDAEASSANAE